MTAVNYTADQAEFRAQVLELKQGTIIYNQPGVDTGPVYAPVAGTPIPHDVDGYVNGVGQMYRNSTLIVETDKLVTAAVFGVTPTVQGTLSIDGRVHQIVQVTQVPAAGVPVTWRIVCRA